jgi:hypothetical protein
MRPSRVVVLATLTIVGWAWIAKKSSTVRRVPGLA